MSAPHDPLDSGGWWSRIWRRLRAGASPDSAVRGLDEERRALKAAILRKRHNDRVRHEELNELRAWIHAQRAAAGPADAPPVMPPSLSGAAGVRGGGAPPESDPSRTIEQIARIEAQMAQHWTPQATEGSGQRMRVPAPAATEAAVCLAQGRRE